MTDLKTAVGFIIFGGMALLLLIMFGLYFYARHKRIEAERLQKIKDDKANSAIRKIEEKLYFQVQKTGEPATYFSRTLHIKVWPKKKRFY